MPPLPIWNPWHGCHKISAGCLNCYVYRRDESVGRDASAVARTADFDLPVRRDRHWAYRLQPDGHTVFTCMTSDFFLEDADPWRPACWQMMRQRSDLHFAIITKRIHRFAACLPPDWGEGYPNVSVYCTVENQEMADYRLPIYLTLPIRHKHICHEPMLGPIQIEPYLASGQIEYVLCGGESGPRARPCHYEWVLDTRAQCVRHGVAFHFKQTGAVFVKDGRTYRVPRRLQHSQAARAGIEAALRANPHCIIDSNDAGGNQLTADYAAALGCSLEEMRVRIATGIGDLVAALFRSEAVGTLLMTGGDTLLQAMRSAGVRELEPICEMEKGVVLAKCTYNGCTKHVITKSGGFGQASLLTDLAARLAAQAG